MWCVCGDGCFIDVLCHDVLCLTVVDGFMCVCLFVCCMVVVGVGWKHSSSLGL